MVELCNIERMGWTAMTIATAIVAATPWLHPAFEHGKLRGASAPPSSRVSLLGRLIHAGVSKRLFSHFYCLAVGSCLLVFADVFVFAGSLFTTRIQRSSVCSRIAGRSESAPELGAESLLILALLALHSARRLWECTSITSWGSSTMSIVAYAVGILHYQLMVLTVLVEAPPLGHLVREARLGWGAAATVGSALAQSVCFRHAAAVGLFIVGFTRQHEAIVHLATLRGGTASGGSSSSSSSTAPAAAAGSSSSSSSSSSNTYAIPTMGWFQYVSCPHYLAELLVYASFVLLGSFKGRGLGQGYLVVFAWVFANQALVAGRAHVWYLQKFEGYPRERKRLIPGVW